MYITKVLDTKGKIFLKDADRNDCTYKSVDKNIEHGTDSSTTVCLTYKQNQTILLLMYLNKRY